MGDEELPYLPSSQAADKVIEECAEISESPTKKRKSINYVAESYKHFCAHSSEMQTMTKHSLLDMERKMKMLWNGKFFQRLSQ